MSFDGARGNNESPLDGYCSDSPARRGYRHHFHLNLSFCVCCADAVRCRMDVGVKKSSFEYYRTSLEVCDRAAAVDHP